MNQGVQVDPRRQDPGLRPEHRRGARPSSSRAAPTAAKPDAADEAQRGATAQLDLAKAEGFTFNGADGDEVAGWIVKPPGFDPARNTRSSS